MIFLGLLLMLVGGALIETPIIGFINGENGIAALIFGLLCGGIMLAPGIIFFSMSLKELIQKRQEVHLKDVLEALRPGFKEATGKSALDDQLLSFREHYSDFLTKEHITENEPIQSDVTQIFRNILQFQKNRLTRLNITCETLIRRMKYMQGNGISIKKYADGKYNITDVKEEVAARTIYRRAGKVLYTKTDRDIANYTIIAAQQVGEDRILCPNCGAETTRDALLDGCDYCGTRFSVEDLGSRIAVFAFRPDYKLREEKYKRTRNRTIFTAIVTAVLAVFLGFSVYGIVTAPELFAAGGGFILTLLAGTFAVIVASPIYILAFVIVYFEYLLPIALVLLLVNFLFLRKLRKKKTVPMMDRDWEKVIRDQDPYFSIANFYSGLQNKLSAMIFAENEKQFQAFADAGADIMGFYGRYRDVIGVDVDRFQVLDYKTDEALQYADVLASLILTRYNGKKCSVRNEKIELRLVKAADCKTQIVCAPAVMTCKGCGHSLDLLQGKECPYCGKELELGHYDWVIRSMHAAKRFSA